MALIGSSLNDFSPTGDAIWDNAPLRPREWKALGLLYATSTSPPFSASSSWIQYDQPESCFPPCLPCLQPCLSHYDGLYPSGTVNKSKPFPLSYFFSGYIIIKQEVTTSVIVLNTSNYLKTEKEKSVLSLSIAPDSVHISWLYSLITFLIAWEFHSVFWRRFAGEEFFCFCVCEKDFISPRLLKNICWKDMLRCQFFCFSTWQMVCHLCLDNIVSNEKAAVTWVVQM